MQSTRQEILEILRAEGQATVEDLAERLELTAMTIRHHLNVLQAQKLVEASKVRRSQKVGRPRLVYTLTEAADEVFPQRYGDLARYLVGAVKETMDAEEVRQVFRLVADQIARQAPPPIPGQTFEQRLDQVVEFMNSQGFIGHWEKADGAYVLINVNCPYRRVSREHGEVCIMDTTLLEQLLGVEPQRLGGMQAGDLTCSFLLVPPE